MVNAKNVIKVIILVKIKNAKNYHQTAKLLTNLINASSVSKNISWINMENVCHLTVPKSTKMESAWNVSLITNSSMT